MGRRVSLDCPPPGNFNSCRCPRRLIGDALSPIYVVGLTIRDEALQDARICSRSLKRSGVTARRNAHLSQAGR